MSLQRVKLETTSSEAVDWMRYFEQDGKLHKKEDYLTAQIVMAIEKLICSLGKSKKKLKLTDYLLESEEPRRKIKKLHLSKHFDADKRTQAIKRFIFAFVGHKPKE